MDLTARTIAALLASQAERRPDRAAIRAPGRDAMTYDALHAASVRVAATLRELGIGARDRVAVVLPNGPEMAVAFLGVAGAAACAPLNPAAKESELAFALRDLGVAAVLTEVERVPAAVRAAKELSLPIVSLVPHADGVAGAFDLDGTIADSPAEHAEPSESDVALLLHTSGTTARPKTVPLTQHNLRASAANVARTLALRPDDACLNVMPLFHIHGLVAALLASLEAGASVVCTPGFRAPDFLGWLREEAPSWYTAVPTIHQAVLDACAGRTAIEGSRLRLIRSSSASLPPRVLEELEALFQVPVIEAYGMTEAAHQMASNPVDGVRKVGSVGPAAGPEIAVLDDAGKIAGRGVVGELVIRGETVTAGYEGDPAINASAFTDGWFRTGDQGYLDDDGYVYLTGRLKELINRGGEKIAPREVEEALLRHPAVAQAVAFAAPHARLGEEVAAAIVLRDGARASADELRRAASEQLAYFKVPRRIAIVDQIPKGATGKLQRNGLAEKLGLDARAEDGTAPRTPRERDIAEVWRRVLRLDTVGIDEDFFAIGGDSLAAAEMIEAVGLLLQTEIPVADFLEQPTIAWLARLHERALDDVGSLAHDLVPIRSGGDAPPVFCVGPHDGNLWSVSTMLRHLPIDCPVYGFPPPPVTSRGPLPTIADLAERNLRALERVQPDGPVRLVGACFGGTVALEMASRLERREREVELLAMVNSFNRAWRSTHAESRIALRARHLVARVRLHRARIGEQRGARLRYLLDRARLTRRHWADEARRFVFELTTRLRLPRPQGVRRAAYANRHAQRTHRARPYSGRVLMVHAAAPIAGVYPLPLMGWADVLHGEVELIELPCEQLEFWSDERLLRGVARRIGEILDGNRRHAA